VMATFVYASGICSVPVIVHTVNDGQSTGLLSRRFVPFHNVSLECRRNGKAASADLSLTRKQVLHSIIAAPLLLASVAAESAKAAETEVRQGAVSDADTKNPLIEKLLERSRQNKAKYDEERLQDYYKRNFTDYFNFLGGNLSKKKELTESEKGILKWLEANK